MMAQRSSNNTARPVLVMLAAVVVWGTVVAGTAHAQEDTPRFTAPPSQGGVTVGVPFTVEGTGCPPDSEVSVTTRFGLDESTTSDADGDFSVSATVPEGVFDFSTREETTEFILHGTCAGQEIAEGPLLAVAPADPPEDDEQVSHVPEGGVDTGAGGTARSPSSPIGIPLVVLSILAVAAVIVVARSTRRSAR